MQLDGPHPARSHKRRPWRWAGVGLLVLGLGSPLAQTGAAAPLWPEGFDGVALGQLQPELRRLRPAAVEGGFKGDQAGHPKMLFEKLASPFIDRAIYLFDDARPALKAVVYVKDLPAQDPAGAARAFRAAVVAKWGPPSALGGARGEGGEPQLLLVWKRSDAVVVAATPAGGAAAPAAGGARGRGMAVRIGARGSEVETLADRREPLEAKSLRDLEAELRAAAKPAGAAHVFR